LNDAPPHASKPLWFDLSPNCKFFSTEVLSWQNQHRMHDFILIFQGGLSMYRLLTGIGVSVVLVLATGFFNVVSADDKRADRNHDDNERRRIERGFKIAPVPLQFKHKNRDLVGLGSYTVNAQGGCNDCHTSPPYADGGDPFAGQPKKVNTTNYLAAGQVFGPFVSRNITPDPENGRPAGLTFKQFRELMRTGVDPDQAHPEISPLLQVMPWPVYGEMTPRDLRAVYEYLRAIPHAEPPAPAEATRQQR
jgi:hypothetical protein